MRVETIALAALLLILINAAGAEDFFDMIEAETTQGDERVENPIDILGNFTQRLHYAVVDQREDFPFRRERAGLAAVRSDLLLQARYRTDYDLALHVATLASYDAKLNEPTSVVIDQTYVEWGVTPSLNVKVGRQLISLGESNYFQVADRINPVDERAFGLAELRESSLPVTSTRLSYYAFRWGVDLVAVHEFRKNFYDEPYGDFDPYIVFRDQPSALEERKPDVGLARPDIAGRVFWALPWGDVALFASRLHSREAKPMRAGGGALTLDYPEITLLGASGNVVMGSWLLKSEYAYSDGDLYQVKQSAPVPAGSPHDLSSEGQAHRLMVGGRYSGVRNLTLDLELLSSFISATDGRLGEDRVQIQGVASVEYEMLSNDLVANITYMSQTTGLASMLRVRLDYTVGDDLVMFGGAINYAASTEDSMLAPYRKNDRVFMGLTFNF